MKPHAYRYIVKVNKDFPILLIPYIMNQIHENIAHFLKYPNLWLFTLVKIAKLFVDVVIHRT
jgi:hypothetical protein